MAGKSSENNGQVVSDVGGLAIFDLFAWSILVTLAVLAGAGYLVAQIGVRALRDPFRAGSFEFDLAPGWWCERESGTFVCTPPGAPPHAAVVRTFGRLGTIFVLSRCASHAD
jgi:hypothetical protein